MNSLNQRRSRRTQSLSRFGILGRIVSFFLASCPEVLEVLLGVFPEDADAFGAVLHGSKVEVVDRRRRSSDLDLDFNPSNLGRTEERKMCEFSHTGTHTLARKRPHMRAHTRIERAKLPRRIIDVPLRNLAIAFVNPALLHPDALTSRDVSR